MKNNVYRKWLALTFGGWLALAAASAAQSPGTAAGKQEQPAAQPAGESSGQQAARASASNASTTAAPGTAEALLAALEELRRTVEAQGRRLEQQNALLEAQRARLAELEGHVGAQSSGSGPADVAGGAQVEALEGQIEALAEHAHELTERVAKTQSELTAAQRSTESRLRQIGNFTFSGDFRARYEPFVGGGVLTAPATPSRHRPRFRLRFNTAARFSPEWSGGFSLASGDDSDPISTNQTLTSFFQRKAVRIDRAFVEYNPAWMKNALQNRGEFRVTAGKFAYTWYNTELTFDSDTNPEGLSQTLAFNFKNPALKNLTLVAFQLPFNESGSGRDSFLLGGQVQTRWQMGARARLSLFAGFYDWTRADVIRGAQTAGTLTGSTNRHAATATQFASNFAILDLIGRVDFTTWSSRWPLMLQLNYAANTRACGNAGNIAGTPPACNPRDRDAWWAEAQIGQNREAGDLLFSYTFIRIEREAVMGAFNFSDLRAPTNVVTHRLKSGYQANRNVNLGFTILFGRQLTTATSPEERYQKRMQGDLVYRF